MSFYDEQQEKEAAYRAQFGQVGQANQANQRNTMGGFPCDEPERLSLQERIYHQKRRAEREAVRAAKLAELLHLLEKNPEVARILDLMEEVGK